MHSIHFKMYPEEATTFNPQTVICWLSSDFKDSRRLYSFDLSSNFGGAMPPPCLKAVASAFHYPANLSKRVQVAYSGMINRFLDTRLAGGLGTFLMLCKTCRGHAATPALCPNEHPPVRKEQDQFNQLPL